MIGSILRQLLAEQPLDSTWYYQDKTIAALEYSILQALAADPYSDREETAQLLAKEATVFSEESIQKQMRFMSLYAKEERLIFFAILQDLLAALRAVRTPEAYSLGVYEVLRAVAQEETADGKIKSYVDNFIYLPKCALVALAEESVLTLTASEKEKFRLIKPKFAKYCLNEILTRRQA